MPKKPGEEQDSRLNDLVQRLCKLQQESLCLKEINTSESLTNAGKKEFIDILLNAYFGDSDKFKVFYSLGQETIGHGVGELKEGYVQTDTYQALCFGIDSFPSVGYLVFLEQEKDSANLYYSESIREENKDRLGDITGNDGKIEGPYGFFRIDTDYLVGMLDQGTKFSGKEDIDRFYSFCSGLSSITGKAIHQYQDCLANTKQEEERISNALKALKSGLEKLKH